MVEIDVQDAPMNECIAGLEHPGHAAAEPYAPACIQTITTANVRYECYVYHLS